MTPPHHSIFRLEALQRYQQAQAQFPLLRPAAPVMPLVTWLTSRLARRHMPVLRQMSTVECGAACLAMILSYYGRQTRVAEIRNGMEIGRDGVTARMIAQTARRYGLRVKAYSIAPAEFQHLQCPVIVHWTFNHFIVVERWTAARVDIIDPAVGRRSITAAEFDAGFTGIVLTFEPGAHFQTRPAAGEPAWRLYLRGVVRVPGYMAAVVQLLGASVVLQGLGLVVPAATAVLVDQMLPQGRSDLLTTLGVGLGVVILTQVVVGLLRARVLVYLQTHLDARLMLGFFEHLLALPFRFFQSRTSGDLLMRLTSNMVLREILTGQTVAVLLDSLLVLAYLALLLLRDSGVGLLTLGLGTLQIALLAGTARRLQQLSQQELGAQAASQSYLVEALTGMATLKVSGAEDSALDHWSNLFTRHLNVARERRHLAAVLDTVLSALRTFAPLLMLWLGALRVMEGTLSLGTMLALQALAVACLTPLASLVATGQQLHLVGAHLERIADVLEATPEQERQAVRPAARLTGRIELRQVSFQYDPHTPSVLRDISCTITPGQKVALVGRTGSGKSTLAMLLLGLYPPTSGEILYDNVPLQELEYQTLRRQCGVVLQENVLFSGSIRQNLALHDPCLSLEEISTAAQLAAIHDDIVHMPMGYETVLTAGGTNVSGGQRQRLALARALTRRPAILLLDEATSHLDLVTEAQVEHNCRHWRALLCASAWYTRRMPLVTVWLRWRCAASIASPGSAILPRLDNTGCSPPQGWICTLAYPGSRCSWPISAPSPVPNAILPSPASPSSQCAARWNAVGPGSTPLGLLTGGAA